MKSIVIETIAKIILVIITISLVVYIMYSAFFSRSEEIYCTETLRQGVFDPKCTKYYSLTRVVKINGSYDSLVGDIAGFILKCYNDYIEKNYSIVICYSIDILNKTKISKKDIINFLKDYTTFDTSILYFSGSLNNDDITYEKQLFIIFNNSKIYLWQ